MHSTCHSCANTITDLHVTCRGFCNEIFHPNCCGINSPILDEVMNNIQLFWMCKTCSKLMNDIRTRQAIRVAYESGQENVLSAHNEIVESLKQEILIELKNEIKSNFSKLINSSSLTPKTSKFSTSAIISTRPRRLFGKPSSNKSPPPPLMFGTSESLSPSLGNFAAAAPSPKFWLYLSRISRDVTIEQMRALVSHRLGTKDVDVVRLVAKGRDISTLAFISFKIGLNVGVKTKALSSSTWPKGIYYREFQDNRTNTNFWKPGFISNHGGLATHNHPPAAPSSIEDADMIDQRHHDAH